MDRVRRSLDAAVAFMSSTSFNPIDDVCVGDKSALFLSLNKAYSSYLQGRVESAEAYYKTANVTNCQVFVATPVVETAASRASFVENPVCVASSSKAKDDGGILVLSVFGDSGNMSIRGVHSVVVEVVVSRRKQSQSQRRSPLSLRSRVLLVE